jgi:transposase
MEVRDHATLETLRRLERIETDVQHAKRLRIIILAIQGFTATSISLTLDICERAVQEWVARYNRNGLQGLVDHRGGSRRDPLTEEEKAQLCQRLDQGAMPDDGVCSLRGRDVQFILAQEYAVWRRLSSIYALLHRLGYSCLRPRPKHHKSDPAAMAEFVEQLPERLAAVAAAHQGCRLRVYFEDESRFGQQGTITNVWARRGSRPTAVRQTEYEYLWVLGAVCPETGQAEGLLSPGLNTGVINVFLEQFSASLRADEHAVLIWDGAGFHTSKSLRLPQNVTVLQLPAYSPELNPIENLWHYLKSHFWSNRAYAGYDELEAAAIDAWHRAVLNPTLIKSVCTAKYLNHADLN